MVGIDKRLARIFNAICERPEKADQRIGARNTVSGMGPSLWASVERTHAVLREDDGRSEGLEMDTMAPVLVTTNTCARIWISSLT